MRLYFKILRKYAQNDQMHLYFYKCIQLTSKYLFSLLLFLLLLLLLCLTLYYANMYTKILFVIIFEFTYQDAVKYCYYF